MLEKIIRNSRSLPEVTNFFSGKKLSDGFQLPSDILLFCHDYDFPQTIISSRYMLIFPFTEITYEVEEQLFCLHMGEAILVNPFVQRSVPSLHQKYLRLIVSFEVTGAQSYLPSAPVMSVSNKAWGLVDKLLHDYKHDAILSASFTLVQLLEELSRHLVASTFQKVSMQVNHTMSILNQYLGESFGIKDLAAQVHWSASHLRRQFRKETGISLGEYARRLRLCAAQRLLLNTEMKVEEIARRCGYDTVYSFSRFFKNCMGMSPLKFRNMQLR